MSTRQLTALVPFESVFENTATIADLVAGGLEDECMLVSCVDVADDPPLTEIDRDLLLVGAPTPAVSLIRPGTRQEAVRQGAPAARAHTGVRDWLE